MSSPDPYTTDDAARTWDSIKDTPPRDPPGGGHGGKQSQRLVADARARARVFTGDDGVFYLAEHARGIEAYPIRSTRTRRWLNRLYRAQSGGDPPSTQAMAEALETLESLAEVNGVFPVRSRIAATPERVLLDLGNDAGQVVDITACGWQIREASDWKGDPPTYFLRPRNALALPLPDRDGALEDVYTVLGAVSHDDRVFVAAYLLHCFQPGGDYWILVVGGEQGSAKTYTAEAARMLIDPSRIRSSGPPRDEDALIAHANTVAVVVLDNLSRIDERLSDALCRLSSGGGLLKRALYTDLDAIGWYGARPVILTSIADIVNAADLLDRALLVTMPTLEDGAYIPDKVMWARFHTGHARALGGLLNTLVQVMAAMPDVSKRHHRKLPRMADATLYGVALEHVTGAPVDPADGFLARYRERREQAMALQLEDSPVVRHLKRVLGERPQWQGTMTDLLDALNAMLTCEVSPEVERDIRHGREWPKAPNALSSALRKLAPALRKQGITIERDRPERGQSARVTVRWERA